MKWVVFSMTDTLNDCYNLIKIRGYCIMKFHKLVEYFERLEATTKRLEMFDILSELFKEAHSALKFLLEIVWRAKILCLRR